jgi:hypothetical protein
MTKLATAGKASPQRSAAERALAALRAARKPVDDFKNLRQEVLDLQKTNREMKKELEDLKKQVEAGKVGMATGSPGARQTSKKSPGKRQGL